jgi:hypothetical protein
MRAKKLLLPALLLLSPLLSAAPAARPQAPLEPARWSLDSDREGIALYSASVPGTKIIPFKCVMSLPAGIEEISAVLEDAPRRHEWISRFAGSALLERASDYEQTEYLRMSLPWPFLDRTALLRVKITVSPGRDSASIAASSVTLAAKTGLPELVRCEIYDSTFQMLRTPKGTEVTALVFIDPKGNLPAWVVNLFTSKVSRRTLEGLRRQVGRKLYSAAELEAMHQRIMRYAEFISKK